MTGTINRVILVGNMGQDPDVVGRDGSIVKLSIATSEAWRDKASGERKERTEWHRVVIFDEAAASFAKQYLKKGMKVYVEGMQSTRKWTDDKGVERWSTETLVKAFSGKVESLAAVGRREPSEDDYGTSGSSQDESRARAARLKAAKSMDDIDSEIPF